LIVYGRNPVREALRGPRNVRRLWAVGEERLHGLQPGDARVEAGLAGLEEPPAVVGADERELLCGSRDNQGLACEAEDYRYAEASELLESERALVVALDQVQDPQNLGAVCRSAECAGAAGVVVPERRSADVTAAVCRASAGAVEHLAVARVRNLADYLIAAKDKGAWVYGADPEAGVAYTEPDYGARSVLVLGAEGSGLRPRVKRSCDQLVALPVRGEVDSLNVAATAAVLLYEALRQRASARA
jgi:23S rRNA (guanosine2251-2'-O)-methyltransferase